MRASPPRVPGPRDHVHKDECAFSFDTPLSPGGVYISLVSWQAYGSDYVALDHECTGCQLYLHEQWTRVRLLLLVRHQLALLALPELCVTLAWAALLMHCPRTASDGMSALSCGALACQSDSSASRSCELLCTQVPLPAEERTQAAARPEKLALGGAGGFQVGLCLLTPSAPEAGSGLPIMSACAGQRPSLCLLAPHHAPLSGASLSRCAELLHGGLTAYRQRVACRHACLARLCEPGGPGEGQCSMRRRRTGMQLPRSHSCTSKQASKQLRLAPRAASAARRCRRRRGAGGRGAVARGQGERAGRDARARGRAAAVPRPARGGPCRRRRHPGAALSAASRVQGPGWARTRSQN